MDKPARTRSHSGSRPGLYTRTALCGALYGLITLFHAGAQALPVGGLAEVSAGGAPPTITSTDTATNVKLNAPRTVLSWSTFDVKPTESVNFAFDAKTW